MADWNDATSTIFCHESELKRASLIYHAMFDTGKEHSFKSGVKL